MVVLVIVGILASVMTISSRPDPHRQLALQAERVGLLMGLAADEARLRRAPIFWEADLRGYRFVQDVDGSRTTFAGDDMLRERAWEPALNRLAVVDLASGTVRTLLNSEAPALRVSAGREWVQPRWRLELANEFTSVAMEFDANGHAGLVP